jgi:hypothetical protein
MLPAQPASVMGRVESRERMRLANSLPVWVIPCPDKTEQGNGHQAGLHQWHADAPEYLPFARTFQREASISSTGESRIPKCLHQVKTKGVNQARQNHAPHVVD